MTIASFAHRYAASHLYEDIIIELLNAGDEVTLVQIDRNNLGEPLPESLQGKSGLTHHEIAFQAEKSDSFVKRYLDEIKFFNDCKKLLHSEPVFDVALVKSCHVPFAAASLKPSVAKRVVYNEQDLFPLNALCLGALKQGLKYRVLEGLTRKGYSKSDAIVTISSDMKDSILAFDPNVDVRIIRNWEPDSVAFKDSDGNPVLEGLPESEKAAFRVVYAGNVGKMQNVLSIVEAADALRDQDDIVFYIVGDGACKKQVAEEIARRSLSNVRLRDSVSPDEASYVYKMASLNLVTLVDGAIYACMPSKIASCIEARRPFLITINEASKAAKELSQLPNCYVCDPFDGETSLSDGIVHAKNSGESPYANIESTGWNRGCASMYVQVLHEQ